MAGKQRRGIQQRVANRLRIWAKSKRRSGGQAQSTSSLRLSRRGLLVGVFGLAAAAAAARVATSVTSPPTKLPIFKQATSQAGITFRHQRHTRAHAIQAGTAFLDFDNDGLLDIYFAAGRLHPAMNSAGEYLPDQPNALFHNRGDGTFEDVSQLTDSDHTGCARGLAVADVDADGFLDLLVTNLDQPPVLLKNSGNDNRWLEVQLVGVKSNRDGIGARLTLTAGGSRQIREIQSGTSFLSQHSLVAHFGLGRHRRVDKLKLRWPSGIVQTLTDLSINRRITITEAV